MAHTDFGTFNCSIARTVDVVGERWTPMILRDVVLGVTRFDDIQRDLGVARNVLAARLDALVGGRDPRAAGLPGATRSATTTC